jgi:hypothetical protein
MNLTERQKEIATGLTILLAIGLGFGAGEAALRIVQMAKFGTPTTVEESVNFAIDAVTGLRLPVPGSTHGRINYNSLGFRGPELQVPKPDGALRIAYLGSSTTLDPYSSDSGSWTAVATEVLQQAVENCEIDYLNAGVAGFATDRMLRYFDGRVRQAEPDVVVVVPSDINLDLDSYMVRHGLHDGLHYRPSWLARHSVLWSKLEMNATIIKRQRAAMRSNGRDDIPVSEIVPAFDRRLRALVSAIRMNGSQPVLLMMGGQVRRGQSKSDQVEAAATDLFYMPYITIEGLLDVKDQYARVVRRVGSDLQVPVIALRSTVPADKEHYRDSSHYTPVGSAKAGRAIGEALRDLPAMRERIDRCAAARTEGS